MILNKRASELTFILLLVLLTFCFSQISAAAGPASDNIVELCRQFLSVNDEDLSSDEKAQRMLLRAQLASYNGDIDAVFRALRATTHKTIKPGYYAEKRFQSPAFREKYPHDLLYFIVPPEYDTARPTGLIVFLHGGGKETSRDAPHYTMRIANQASSTSDRSGKMLAATGMITVGPSAPGKYQSYYRWCLPQSEEYLVDVIEDCKDRFNIDPNRVFLLGHSMGGFGAYHHALRQPDRFAAIIVSSGSWDRGFWPVVRGTPLCIVHGVNDAQKENRWHHTDIEHARNTHKILHREGLDHKYCEHDGYHGFSENRADIANYFESAANLRRDPYYPHITIATPQGFSSNYVHAVQHNRWLTIDETTSGSIKIDELVSIGNNFDEWRLEPRRPQRRGALIDAINGGNNTIEITTQNIAAFTVWLHPKMVDVSKPVIIVVDKKIRFSGHVKSNLVTVLESYQRRRDWGLLYPIKIELRIAKAE